MGEINSKTNEVLDDNAIDELIQFFDSCVLERDRKEVLERMEKSATLRKESYRTSRKILDKCFQLYRVDMELVSFFFSIKKYMQILNSSSSDSRYWLISSSFSRNLMRKLCLTYGQ